MRILRPLLIVLGCLIGLAALIVGAAFTSPVQTWAIEHAFSRQSDFEVTVGSATLGRHHASLHNVEIRRGKAILVVPSLEAELDVKTALLDNKLEVETLIAKGWTLDLTNYAPDPNAKRLATEEKKAAEASAAPVAANVTSATAQATTALRGLLAEYTLTGTWHQLELEGTVALAASTQASPAPFHVVLQGKDLVPGKTADFVFEMAGNVRSLWPAFGKVAADGRLTVGVAPSRAIDHLGFDGAVYADNVLPPDVRLVASIATIGNLGDENFGLAISRGTRPIAKLGASFLHGQNRLTGTWEADLRETDFGIIDSKHRPPFTIAAGEGKFDSDLVGTTLHTAGHMKGQTTLLGLIAPGLPDNANATFDGNFELTRANGTLNVQRLHLTLAEDSATADIDALQPFTIAEETGNLAATDPKSDWLRGTLRDVPVAWLWPTAEGRNRFVGTLDGALTLSAATDGSLIVRSTGPLAAKHISIFSAGRPVLQGVDVSAPLTATYVPKQGWTITASPLAIEAGNKRLATFDLKGSTVRDPYGRFPWFGTWTADLDAIAAQPLIGGRWIRAKSSTGEFAFNAGPAADVKAKFTIVGHDPSRTISVSLNAGIDDYTSFSLRAPLKLGVGNTVADVDLEGTWVIEPAGGQRVDLRISSNTLTLEHVRLVGDSLPMFAPQETPDSKSALTVPKPLDRPFWAPLVGRIRVDARELTLGAKTYRDVGATIAMDQTTLQLNGGRVVFAPQPVKASRSQLVEMPNDPFSPILAEGTLTFDPTATQSYALKGTGSMESITTVRLMGDAAKADDFVVQGNWTLTAAITSAGATPAELIRNRQDDLHLASTAGILRLLRTNIADGLPEGSAPVTDTLANIGAGVGAIFGRKGNTLAAEKKLSTKTENVLNFTHQVKELAYERLAFTAVRKPDGTIALVDLVIETPTVRLSGAGSLGAASAKMPISARPLDLRLEMAFHGVPADRLASVGLLATEKDAKDFRKLTQPVHFGGTLEKVNSQEWHDLLLQAALPPDAKKK